MISAVKALFSSEKLVDNVSAGIDKAIYTAEEKAENFNRILALYAPFKIAQRMLAIVFCVPYALAFLITFIVSFWGVDITLQKELLTGDIAKIVGVVVVFYFGGGALEGVIQSKKT